MNIFFKMGGAEIFDKKLKYELYFCTCLYARKITG